MPRSAYHLFRGTRRFLVGALVSLLLLLLAGCGGTSTSKPSEEARAREWRNEVRLTLLELRDASAAFVSASAKGLPGLRDRRRLQALQRALVVFYPCGVHLEDVTPPLARSRQGIAMMKTACRSFDSAFERGSKGDLVGARREVQEGLALLDQAQARLRLPFCRYLPCHPKEHALWNL